MSEQDGRAILAELFRHNDWANARLLELCQGLSDEALEHRIQGIYGSVRETLQHLVAAQAYFAFLLTGEQPEPPLRSRDPFPGFDVLKGRAEASGRVLGEVAARLKTHLSGSCGTCHSSLDCCSGDRSHGAAAQRQGTVTPEVGSPNPMGQ